MLEVINCKVLSVVEGREIDPYLLRWVKALGGVYRRDREAVFRRGFALTCPVAGKAQETADVSTAARIMPVSWNMSGNRIPDTPCAPQTSPELACSFAVPVNRIRNAMGLSHHRS